MSKQNTYYGISSNSTVLIKPIKAKDSNIPCYVIRTFVPKGFVDKENADDRFLIGSNSQIIIPKRYAYNLWRTLHYLVPDIDRVPIPEDYFGEFMMPKDSKVIIPEERKQIITVRYFLLVKMIV